MKEKIIADFKGNRSRWGKIVSLVYRVGNQGVYSRNLFIGMMYKLIHVALIISIRLFTDCEINPHAKIGKGFEINHAGKGTIIGYHAVIGENFTVYHQVTIGENNGYTPIIGNNVTVFPGAKLFGNIKIGNNVIIGANAVVFNNVPDNSVIGSVPGKLLKKNEIKSFNG